MNNKLKNIIISLSFIIVIVGLMVGNIFSQDKELSYDERRKLSQLPKFTVEKLISGDYFQDMEEYFLDQFVFRESLEELKHLLILIFSKKKITMIFI